VIEFGNSKRAEHIFEEKNMEKDTQTYRQNVCCKMKTMTVRITFKKNDIHRPQISKPMV